MRKLQLGSPGRWSHEESTEISFNQFSQIDHAPGDFVMSPTFLCHGLEWNLTLLPGGERPEDKEEEKKTDTANDTTDDTVAIGIFLCLNQDAPKGRGIRTKFSIEVPKMDHSIQHTSHLFMNNETSRGWDIYGTRRDILDHGCLDDTLTVVVKIQIYALKGKTWTPGHTLQKDMRRLMKSAPDICFLVGKGHAQERIGANCLILAMRAPSMKDVIELTLMNRPNTDAALVGGIDFLPTVSLPDVDPRCFQSMVTFIYTDDTSFLDTDDVSYLKDLLVTVNRFGCWKLKLFIESKLIEDVLNFDTSIDLLLFADDHSCFMLKESALDVLAHSSFVTHKDAERLMESVHLSKEIVRKQASPKKAKEPYMNMSLVELYEHLESAGVELESDGDRSMLLKHLQKKSGSIASGWLLK